jgi:protein-tyrosine phosphatase
MAKVILEHKLIDLAKSEQFTVISAARYSPTNSETSLNARETIKILYKQDLLATHKSKSLTPELTEKADLILVMTDVMKNGLPPNKTYSVKEYGGQAYDVMDPFGGDLKRYLECADELSSSLNNVVAWLLITDSQ